SPIRKLSPYAEKAKREGKRVYHLNIGQPDIETPQAMLDAIHNVDFKVWAYTPSEGVESYRIKLAGYYNRLGYSVTADDILITNGGSEALSFAMQACVNPGEEIIIPEPFYANYNSFTRGAGIHVVPILSHIDQGFALPPISDFEAAITPNPPAIAIGNPNHPIGYLYARKELEALKDICLKYGLFLVVDEAYREFCYDGREFVSPMQLNGLEEHTVVIDTVSK